MRLTVKERVLLHLLEFMKYAESFDVPSAIAQAGIARAARFRLPHFMQYVRPLLRNGLVAERMAHVQGSTRRKKVYHLTHEGRMAAIRIRDAVKSEVIQVRDSSGVRQASLAQVLQEVGRAASFLEAINQVIESGAVDIGALTAEPRPAPAPVFVAHLTDAPRLAQFVGRQTELERLAGEPDGTRVFVIRGIAGIGKSYLAAKVCELQRGRTNLLWHRIRQWDTRQSVLTKLAEFLVAMGQSDLQTVLSRGDSAHADDVLRGSLREARALLVLDDAQEASPEIVALLAFLKDVVSESRDVRMLVLTRRKLPFYDRRDVVLGGLVEEIDLEGLGLEDIAILMGSGRQALTLVDIGQRLGGHPLSLELLRSATPSATDVALRDVERFIEEEIDRDLSEGERTAMKAVSLYQVPVPREVLLSLPSASRDSLLSLQNRALLRRVGVDSYEVHDTIRGFFTQILTRAERESLGEFAAEQLRHLALQAQRDGDLVLCINCLKNALELLPPGVVDSGLIELLGDSYNRIGDLPAALEAYRRTLKALNTAQARARVRGKIASALEDRGDIARASAEVEAGLEDSAGAVTAERGWLDLIRCRIAYRLADWEQARDAGETAREIFLSLDVPAGQARALLILAHIAMHSPENDPALAKHHLAEALELSASVEEMEFAADVRIALAHLLAWHMRDLQGALQQLAAIVELETVTDLPYIRRKIRLFQGMLRLVFFADYDSAKANFRSALNEAHQIHDAATVSNAKIGLAYAAYLQGRFAEARRLYEEAAAGLRDQGLLVDTVNLILAISEAYFLEGNQPASAQVATTMMTDSSLSRAVDARSFYVRLVEGYLYLLQGDREEAYTALEDAVTRATAKSGIGEGTMTHDFVSCISWPAIYALLYSGVALRFLGRDKEGDEQIVKAKEIAEAYGAKAWLEAIPRVERGIMAVFEDLLGEPGRST